MVNDIPELELSLKHCLDVGSPSVVISMTTIQKYFPESPHPDYPETPCFNWDNLKQWASNRGWEVKVATEDTENGTQIIPGIRFSPLKVSASPNSTTNPSSQKHPNGSEQQNKPNLLNSPIGYVWLTAIGGVLAVIIIFLIRSHLGIPL